MLCVSIPHLRTTLVGGSFWIGASSLSWEFTSTLWEAELGEASLALVEPHLTGSYLAWLRCAGTPPPNSRSELRGTWRSFSPLHVADLSGTSPWNSLSKLCGAWRSSCRLPDLDLTGTPRNSSLERHSVALGKAGLTCLSQTLSDYPQFLYPK